MASTISKVSIALGLLNIPVKITAAARAEGISFNLLHNACNCRIRQKTVCPNCGDVEVSRADLVKGYEFEKDKYLTFTQAEIDAISAESSKVMEITSVVKRDEVDPLLFEASYYLTPDLGGRQGYKLLLLALEQEDKVALATITMHQRSHVVVIRAARGCLVFHTVFYHSEVRLAPAIDLSDVSVKPDAIRLTRELLKISQEPFTHQQYSDSYVQAATEMIEAKRQAKPAPKTKVKSAAKQPVDILDAIAASIKAKKGRKVA